MAEHTPGPWQTGDRGSGSYNDRLRIETESVRLHPQSGHLGSRMYLHTVVAYCREPEPGVGEANARLVAAAPELLAALTELVECKDFKERLDGWEAGSTQEMAAMAEEYDRRKPAAWEAARAAIAKARGSHPPQDREHG